MELFHSGAFSLLVLLKNLFSCLCDFVVCTTCDASKGKALNFLCQWLCFETSLERDWGDALKYVELNSS